MKKYFLKRILTMIPMFFLMTILYFSIQNYLPGGPVQEALAQITGLGAGEQGSGQVLSVADIEKLRHDLEVQYQLDKPVLVRYFIWVKNMLHLDFGLSSTTRSPAMDQVIQRLPISLSFGLPSFFLTYLICIPLGILMALKDGSRFDLTASFLLFVFYSIPSLIFAVLFLILFCTDRILPFAPFFPLGGWKSPDFDSLTLIGKFFDIAHHLFLPVLATMLSQFTVMSLLQKNSMLEVIHADYIRTAQAKGLSYKKVMWKHALRNALLPMMVGFGAILATFLAGSLIVEPIFGIPGLGQLSLQALTARDFNVIMAIIVLQSLAILIGQLLSDIAYALVDPRIEYR